MADLEARRPLELNVLNSNLSGPGSAARRYTVAHVCNSCVVVPDDCIACSVADGESTPPRGVLIQSDHWLLNHRLPEKNGETWEGWFVLQPIRHVIRFDCLRVPELQELGPIIQQVEKDFLEHLGADRLYLAHLGSTAEDHLHLHLVPVSEGVDTGKLPGLVAFGSKGADPERVQALLDRLPLQEWGAINPPDDDEKIQT